MGHTLPGVRDAVLEWVRMIPSNRYTYKIFIDNSLTYRKWECQIFSLSTGALQKINEEHWAKPAEWYCTSSTCIVKHNVFHTLKELVCNIQI